MVADDLGDYFEGREREMGVNLKSDIEIFLEAFRGQQALFIPNPGNAGDSVIACAECQLFAKAGIDYQIVSLDISNDDTCNKIIFYGGGGNLVKSYTNARDFIMRHHRDAQRLIILPHTIVAYADLLTELGANVDIICREQISLDYVSRFAPAANIYQMHDAAFSLDFNALSIKSDIADGARLKRLLRAAKRVVRVAQHGFKNRSQRQILNAFRGDVEGTGRSVASANFDVSQLLAADTMSIIDSNLTTRCVVKFINRFDIVRTDRLHVCIVSLLLGKEVHFFDNSYGKNRAVYEYSMHGRYAGLQWCD